MKKYRTISDRSEIGKLRENDLFRTATGTLHKVFSEDLEDGQFSYIEDSDFPLTVVEIIPVVDAPPQSGAADLHSAVRAGAQAAAEHLDLDHWERHGWPGIAEDLATAIAPVVLEWAAQHHGARPASDALRHLAADIRDAATAGRESA